MLTLLMAGSGYLETNPRLVGVTGNSRLKQLAIYVLCEKCCLMIDHILMAMNTTLNLCGIPHLKNMLGGLEADCWAASANYWVSPSLTWTSLRTCHLCII